MEALVQREWIGASSRKYPDEMCERARRIVVEAREQDSGAGMVTENSAGGEPPHCPDAPTRD